MVAEMLGISMVQARSLLAQTNGDVEAAVDLFQEQLQEQQASGPAPSFSAPPPFFAPAPAAQPKPKPGQTWGARIAGMSSLGGGDSDEGPSRGRASGQSQPSKAKKPSGSGPRIATFSSMARSDDDEDDKDEEYFAGSGQAIAGPPGKGKKLDERQATFAAARGHGAQGAPAAPSSNRIELVFYSDGFALRRNGELGPLRDPKLPENRKFLESVRAGHVPEELHEIGEDVDVALVDEHDKPYPPQPKRPAPTFTGEGMVLGASAPAPASVLEAAAAPLPAGEVTCDPSQPATRIQFRLADGTRLVGNFNLSHTLAQVYQFVRLARPDVRPFVLSLSHPRKDLPCENTTVADSDLSNAVVLQRWV